MFFIKTNNDLKQQTRSTFLNIMSSRGARWKWF